jgi:hypothetical protein
MISKWLMAIAFLGAGYMVLTNPTGFYTATSGIKNLIGGTVTEVSTGGKSGVNNPAA